MRTAVSSLLALSFVSALMFGGCMHLEEECPDTAAGEPCSVPGWEDQKAWSVVRVFYGTDRARSGESHWNSYYGSAPGDLEYGVCEVSIPDSHDYGEIERPQIWKLEFNESPDRHIMLQNIQPQTEESFASELQSEVRESDSKEAFVFVHGYNVSFAAATYRTAQMAYDLKFSGPPILYSWPSKGELSGYVADMTSADRSRNHLKEFLETVAHDSGARKVHLIAHSMGNRVVTEALRSFSDEAAFRPVPHFNEIILAAPDVDAHTFKTEIAPRIVQAGDRVTIYTSSNDRALQASRLLHQRPRLGQGGEHLTTFPEFDVIDVVDASWVDFAFFDLGHAEYGDALLGDVKQTLSGQPADRRGLSPYQQALAWTFPASGSPIVQTAAKASVTLNSARDSLQRLEEARPKIVAANHEEADTERHNPFSWLFSWLPW